MTRQPLLLTICLTLLVSVTGCGTETVQGEATTTTSTPTTTRPLPPRPRDISLKGVDPCEVLTDQQLQQLNYKKTRLSRVNETKCSVGNSYGPPPRYSSLISLILDEDITVWLTPERRDGLATVTTTTVAGFPALETTSKLFKDDCQILVDVSDGQYLNILSRSEDGRGTSPEPFCVEAKRVAEMAIQTLLAKQ